MPVKKIYVSNQDGETEMQLLSLLNSVKISIRNSGNIENFLDIQLMYDDLSDLIKELNNIKKQIEYNHELH